MAYGTRVHRRPTKTLFSGVPYRTRASMMIVRQIIAVDAAMAAPVIVMPIEGLPVAYTKDIYQRLYCLETANKSLEKSIQLTGSIYSAPSPGSGYPPGDEDTWSIVSGTTITTDGHTPLYTQMNPALFDGLDFIGLRTEVYQYAAYWTTSFVIYHELWANAARWVASGGGNESVGRGTLPIVDMPKTAPFFNVRSKLVP